MNIKRYFSFLLTTIFGVIITISDVKAGLLTIDDESDIERVTNNVIHFYVGHYDDLVVMEKKGFNKKDCLENLDNITNKRGVLYLDYIRDKKQFIIDFNSLKRYVRTNEKLILTSIGEEKYQVFLSGMFYIHNVLKML